MSADASFAIEIAAEMGGGEQTLTELDELTSEFVGAGKNASAFQDALKQLGTSLDAARAAQVASNAALAEGQAEYARLETAALQAAKAAERLGKGGMTKEYLEAARASAAAEAAVNDYAGTLRTLETNEKRASSEADHLAQTFGNVKKLSAHADKSIAQNAERLSKLQGGLSAISPALGSLGQKIVGPIKGFTELSGAVGQSRAVALVAGAGLAALAVAVIAVGVAVAAATVKFAAWAVGLADTARSAKLSRDAFEAMNPQVAALHGEIDALSKQTTLGTDRLDEIAKSLIDAKVGAEDMSAALRAAALQEMFKDATGGAAAFVEEIRGGQKSVGALARDTQKKLGGLAAKKMLELDATTARLKAGFDGMFSGLNIEPVLQGMSILADLFDENSAAAKTVKFLFETIFQPLIDQATNAAYVVEAFFLGFLIGATKLYIALKPAIQAVEDFFGFDDTSLEDVLGMVTSAGELAAYAFAALAVVFGVVVGAIALLVAGVGAVVGAFLAIPSAVTSAGMAVGEYFATAVSNLINYVKGIDFAQIGTDIMTGLASGITGGAGAIVNAITGAVGGAINAAKSLLGIASPSKVFADIGENTAAGMSGGVESGAGDVQGAMTDMVSPDEALRQAQLSGDVSKMGSPVDTNASGAAPTQAASAAPNLSGATFNFYGVKDGEHAEKNIRELLIRLAEGDASALGSDTETAPG